MSIVPRHPALAHANGGAEAARHGAERRPDLPRALPARGPAPGGDRTPHIVTVYEAGETEHGLFLAMRSCAARRSEREVRDGKLDDERALRILTPVADALDSRPRWG